MQESIVVQGVSKRYRLGEAHGDTMMREALMRFLRSPLATKRQETTLWALKDINFKVNRGEVVGIVGRNGAGKSTLLKVLSRITHPTSGSIQVNGRTASMLEVGTGFHEELTGRENIYLNGSIMGMPKKEIDAKIDEIVAYAGVDKFLDTPIKRYSSGMRMRLGFAVAANLDSDILLVDEVLAVGDMEFQKKCLDTMGELRSGGRTVLFVSHNMAAIENLCQRILWIDKGQIREDGPTETVLKHYMATFSNARTGGADLEKIETRTGHGEARFTGIEFMDSKRKSVDFVASGEQLIIRVHFRAYQEIRDLLVGIELNNDMGMRLTATNNHVTGYYVPSFGPGEGYMDLEIDFLNVMPGRYYLTLWLGPWGHIHDGLQNCIALDVEPADYYGTGRGVDSRYGAMFLPCRWTSDTLSGITNSSVRDQLLATVETKR